MRNSILWATSVGILFGAGVGCSSSDTSDAGGGSSASDTTTSAGTTGAVTTGAVTSSAATSGSTSSGSACGNGICDAGETSESCCADCGCGPVTQCTAPVCYADGCHANAVSAGTPCLDGHCDAEGSCIIDPVCGDGTCNGDETEATCCGDCPCASADDECVGTACAPIEFCGDGVCNAGEDESTCCTDCACSTVGETCDATTLSCVCDGTTAHFANVLTDVSQYCFATGSYYTQKATGYVNVNGNGWTYLPQGGFVDYTGVPGDTFNVQEQCCLIDPCGGNQTCPTPMGNYPCLCANPTTYSVNTNACGETTFPVCD